MTLEFVSTDGSATDHQVVPVPAGGKLNLNQLFAELGRPGYVTVKADKRMLTFVDLLAHDRGAVTWMQTPLMDQPVVPHIAEDTENWTTWAYLSNTALCDVELQQAGKVEQVSARSGQFLELGRADVSDANTANAWVRFQAYASDPFQDVHVLTGWELFLRNQGDGAATSLSQRGSTRLVSPHIPTNTAQFWSGFAFLNLGQGDTSLEMEFYADDGRKLAVQTVQIAAGEKRKGLIEDLFPDVTSECSWAMVQSDEPVVGIQLYGTMGSGICGYDLTAHLSERMILPLSVSSEQNWTGFALVNPNEAEAAASVKLLAADGSLRSEKSVVVPPKNRYKAVVADFFNGMTIHDSDYLVVVSDQPISGVGVSGDHSQTYLKAIAGSE